MKRVSTMLFAALLVSAAAPALAQNSHGGMSGMNMQGMSGMNMQGMHGNMMGSMHMMPATVTAVDTNTGSVACKCENRRQDHDPYGLHQTLMVAVAKD